MALKITSRETTLPYQSDDVDYLIGNVNDYVHTTINIRGNVNARANQNNSMVYDTLTSSFTRTTGSWLEEGFEVGDSCTFVIYYYDIATSTASTTSSTRTITAVTDTVIEHGGGGFVFGLLGTTPWNVPGQDNNYRFDSVTFAVVKKFTACEIKLGLFKNSLIDSPSFNSIIDGSQLTLRKGGLDPADTVTVETMDIIGEKSGGTIVSATIRGTGYASGNNDFEIIITHQIPGDFQDSDNITGGKAPDYYENNEAITDSFEIRLLKSLNDKNVILVNDFSSSVIRKLGNTGWLDENLDGKPSLYTMSNVVFRNNAGAVVSSIAYNEPTTLTFKVAGVAFSTVSSRFGFGIRYVPSDEADYKNNAFTNAQNTLENTLKLSQMIAEQHQASPVIETILGKENSEGARMDVTARQFFVDGANELFVTIKFEPNAAFTDYIESKDELDRLFYFWCSVGNHALLLDSTDRVSLYSFGSFIEAVEDLEPYAGMQDPVFNAYDEDLVPAKWGRTDVAVIKQDDFFIKRALNITIADDFKINSFVFGVEIYNSVTGETFTLDSITANTSSYPVLTTGVQEIAFDSSRNFQYPGTFKHNAIRVYRDSSADGGGTYRLELQYPFRVRYEDWISRPNIPISLFDTTKTLNNLNEDWQSKQMGDWSFREFVIMRTENLTTGKLVNYKNVEGFSVLDYFQSPDLNGEQDYDYEVKILSEDEATNYLLSTEVVSSVTGNYTVNVNGMLTGGLSLIQAIFTTNTAYVLANFILEYAEISIDIRQGTGWLSLWKIRTDTAPQASNPLKPLTGETGLKMSKADIGGGIIEVKLEALIDSTALSVGEYRITGELSRTPAVNAFVSTWNTANTSTGSSGSSSIDLPLIAAGSYNFLVYWGDGSSDLITAWNQPEVTHNYAAPGIYEVTIIGEINGWVFNDGGDKLKLLEIKNWGGLLLGTTQGGYFYGCENLEITAIDLLDTSAIVNMSFGFALCLSMASVPRIGEWDMSSCTDLSTTFFSCGVFNSSVNEWDVSNVTTMFGTFTAAEAFNQPLDAWDVSAVATFEGMFADTLLFNQPLDAWAAPLGVGNVTTIASMFSGAIAFNQNIDSWITTSITVMSQTFKGASSFDQPLNSWNVSNVTTFAAMFEDAEDFNQPLDAWVVTSALTMQAMFERAIDFDQPLGAWDVSGVEDFSHMFDGATSFDQDFDGWALTSAVSAADFLRTVGISTANYDATLVAWDAEVLASGITIDFGTSTYTAAGAGGTARASIISTYSWTINDGGGI